MLLPSGLSYTHRVQFLPCLLKSDTYIRMQCMRGPISTVVKNESAQTALDYVYKLQQADIIADCHVPSHWIGEANLEKYDFDAGRAFATCSEGCIEGCQHGVIEHYMSITKSSDDIMKLCESVGQDEELLYRQCLHGLGHGVISHNKITLPEAVAECQTLESLFATDTCISGVQMEFSYRHIQEGKEVFAKLIPTLCTEFENDWRFFRPCIGGIGYGAMVVTGHDLPESKRLCSLLSDQTQERICVQEANAEHILNRKDLEEQFKSN